MPLPIKSPPHTFIGPSQTNDSQEGTPLKSSGQANLSACPGGAFVLIKQHAPYLDQALLTAMTSVESSDSSCTSHPHFKTCRYGIQSGLRRGPTRSPFLCTCCSRLVSQTSESSSSLLLRLETVSSRRDTLELA